MKEALKQVKQKPANDEYYTPINAVKPLEIFLQQYLYELVYSEAHPEIPKTYRQLKVWEPCCTNGKSGIADALGSSLISVTKTGLAYNFHGAKINRAGEENGFCFFSENPDFDFDVIVTNPPYSQKDRFIKRCFSFGKPWAMLLPVYTLAGKARCEMYEKWGHKYGMRALILDRRPQFVAGKNGSWLDMMWLCHGILPEKLMFAELENQVGDLNPNPWEVTT